MGFDSCQQIILHAMQGSQSNVRFQRPPLYPLRAVPTDLIVCNQVGIEILDL